MDLNFEQLLAQHNQEFKDAEVYSNWMPPDGEYIVSITKLDNGSSSKDGADLLWWRLTGRIEDVQDEKLDGKEFTVGYYTNRAFGILKGAANTLCGEPVDDLAAAHAILEASIGTVIRAKVDTTFSKKYQKDFTNCYIKEVINTTSTALADEPPTTTAKDGVYAETPAPVDIAPEAQVETPAEVPAEAPPVA